jgi:hypothetical protein
MINLLIKKTTLEQLAFNFPDDKFQFENLTELVEKIIPSIEEPGSDGIPDFNLTYTQKAGTYNQKFIWASGFFGNQFRAFVIFDENEVALSFVVLQVQTTTISGTKRTVVKRSWTRPDVRGKGFATLIYLFLVKKLKLNLVCDTHLSLDSVAIYKSFISKDLFDNISFYNQKTKKVQDTEPTSLWNSNNNWRILLDDIITDEEIPLFGHAGYRRLAEICENVEGCD